MGEELDWKFSEKVRKGRAAVHTILVVVVWYQAEQEGQNSTMSKMAAVLTKRERDLEGGGKTLGLCHREVGGAWDRMEEMEDVDVDVDDGWTHWTILRDFDQLALFPTKYTANCVRRKGLRSLVVDDHQDTRALANLLGVVLLERSSVVD